MKLKLFSSRHFLAASCVLLAMTQWNAPAENLVSRYSFNETSGTNVTDSVGGLTAITIDTWFSFTVPNNNVCLFSVDNGSGAGLGGSYFRYDLFISGSRNVE